MASSYKIDISQSRHIQRMHLCAASPFSLYVQILVFRIIESTFERTYQVSQHVYCCTDSKFVYLFQLYL